MARPRKDAGCAGARNRAIAAFWALADAGSSLADISLGAVAAEAGCNRGTLYYHFPDRDALVAAALEEELFSDGMLFQAVSSLLAGADAAELVRVVPPQRLRRFALAMRAGDMHAVDAAVKRGVLARWQRALCKPGEELAPAAAFALRFMVSGALGLIAETVRGETTLAGLGQAERAYLAAQARTTLNAVAHAQGLSPAEALARVSACGGGGAQRIQPPRHLPDRAAWPRSCPIGYHGRPLGTVVAMG